MPSKGVNRSNSNNNHHVHGTNQQNWVLWHEVLNNKKSRFWKKKGVDRDSYRDKLEYVVTVSNHEVDLLYCEV
jgi:hypothetical protein